MHPELMLSTDASDLAQIFATQPTLTSRQLRAAGVNNALIRLSVKRRALIRLGRDIYTLGNEWADLERYVRASRRIRSMANRRDKAAPHFGIVVGPSAAVLWGADLLRLPTLVHLAGDKRSSRRSTDGEFVHGFALRPDEITSINGVLVTTPERTLLDCAAILPPEDAIVVVDSLLHAGADKTRACELFRRHRRVGAAKIRWALDFGNGLAESAGESRARFAFSRIGLPAPELQVELETRRGNVRLDFRWKKYRLACAFDGRIKYGKYADGDPQSVAWNERQRELAIIDTDHELFRLIWDELSDLPLINQRFLDSRDRAIRRFGLVV